MTLRIAIPGPPSRNKQASYLTAIHSRDITFRARNGESEQVFSPTPNYQAENTALGVIAENRPLTDFSYRRERNISMQRLKTRLWYNGRLPTT